MKRGLFLAIYMVAFATLFANDTKVTKTAESAPLASFTNTSKDTLTLVSVIVEDDRNPSMTVHMYSSSLFPTRKIAKTNSTIYYNKTLLPCESVGFEFTFEKRIDQSNLRFTFIVKDKGNRTYAVCCNGN